MPRRPAYGTKGPQVLLFTNYFRVDVPHDMRLHRYDVKVTSVRSTRVPPKAILKRVIELFIRDKLRPNNFDAASDLAATLISRQKLDEASMNADVTYRAEGTTQPEDDANVYSVQLTPNGTLTVGRLLDYSTSTNTSNAVTENQDLIQALNIVVGYQPKTDWNTATIGRNLHVSKTVTPQNSQDLGSGLVALRAFIFSVRAATERLLINVQIKPLAFCQQGPLVALVRSIRRNNKRTDLQAELSVLNRVSVEVTHIQRRSRSGGLLARYKTIFGYATTADGRGQTHPPRVRYPGAGPRDVEFWLDNETQQQPASSPQSPSGESGKSGKKKNKKGKAAAAAGPSRDAEGGAGRYVSVLEFFRTRECRSDVLAQKHY